MKKIFVSLILASLLLSSCSLLGNASPDQDMSDAEMATRVAELLAAMTTPTVEEFFPPTATAAAPTQQGFPSVVQTETPADFPATTTAVVVVSPAPSEEVTATQQPVAEVTATPEQPTSTPQPTATATPNQNDPASRLGSPSSTDPFDSAEHWAWPTGSDSFLSVAFDGGYMKMTGLTNLAGWRLPLVSQQINTYIELTANSGTCTGKDSYGIIFRVPVFKEPEQGYLYEVTCDGYYRLWKWDGKVAPNGQASILVNWKQSPTINAGANQTNRLGVMVIDNKMTLYMNGEKIAEGVDSSYPAGFFGAFVLSRTSDDYTVKFDQMRFWENPTP